MKKHWIFIVLVLFAIWGLRLVQAAKLLMEKVERHERALQIGRLTNSPGIWSTNSPGTNWFFASTNSVHDIGSEAPTIQIKGTRYITNSTITESELEAVMGTGTNGLESLIRFASNVYVGSWDAFAFNAYATNGGGRILVSKSYKRPVITETEDRWEVDFEREK